MPALRLFLDTYCSLTTPHSRTVPSSEAEANSLSSEERTTELTPPFMPT